jgi:integrase
MARQPSGTILEHVGKDGLTYRSLRFTAYGKRRFVSLGAVSASDAAKELRYVLTDVERGTWQPPENAKAPPAAARMPTFHEYAEQWWIRHERQLRERTQVDYRWRLEQHLLPFFADYPLDQITFDLVERYLAAKLAAGRLAPRSVNMTVTLLAAILETAVERELITRNPARGRPRRVREHAPRRTYLHTADEIAALLDAAGELDRKARRDRQHVPRRAMLAVLVLAGLRIGELCALRWRDVDLAAGWLTVGEAKTDAGLRRVKLRGALRDELLAVRARSTEPHPDAFVFATSTGRPPGRENIRNRVLKPATKLASARLTERGMAPLPEGLTPHSLRRTFASVLYALGEDPGVVMDEMGHTTPGLALRIYRQAMRRDEGEKDALRSLVDGHQLAVGGIPSAETAPQDMTRTAVR